MKKVMVNFSGGMDSATLLAMMARASKEVIAVSFNYKQRHKRELLFASAFCKELGVKHEVIDISSLNVLLQGSSLTSENIATPVGHYAAENMKLTVVPNRNMIMASIAIGYAISLGYDTLATAVHAGDHTIYPDCRPEFVEALRHISKIANWQSVEIETPFLLWDKGQIARLGLALGVDFALTWSCYEGGEQPCGVCGACNERAEALAYAHS